MSQRVRISNRYHLSSKLARSHLVNLGIAILARKGRS